MKVTEAPENPDDPNSDIIVSFDFDDSKEDQELLAVLTAGAKAKGITIEEFMILTINAGADRTITEHEAKQKSSRKKGLKKK